jgi:hypothetical protein
MRSACRPPPAPAPAQVRQTPGLWGTLLWVPWSLAPLHRALAHPMLTIPCAAVYQAEPLQELLKLVREQGTKLDRQQEVLDRQQEVLDRVRDQQNRFERTLDRFERTQGILVEATLGAALRGLEQQPKALGSSVRAGVVLRDAASVVECVLPCGLLSDGAQEPAAEVLVAWLVEEVRGVVDVGARPSMCMSARAVCPQRWLLSDSRGCPPHSNPACPNFAPLHACPMCRTGASVPSWSPSCVRPHSDSSRRIVQR